MKTRCGRKSQAGLTLVELVVATAILLTTVAGVMGCVSYAFFVTQIVRENQRATQIVLEKAEILRLYTWDQVNTPGFIPATFTDVYNPQSTDSQGTTYNGTLTIMPYPGGAADYTTNVKQLVITLQWTTGDRVPHTRTLATLIAKDGIQNYAF